MFVREVASSTQTHAAHTRAHSPRDGKPQAGSDFAAMLDEMAHVDTPAEPHTPAPQASSQRQAHPADKQAHPAEKATPTPADQAPTPPSNSAPQRAIGPNCKEETVPIGSNGGDPAAAVSGVVGKTSHLDDGENGRKTSDQTGDKKQAAISETGTTPVPAGQALIANILTPSPTTITAVLPAAAPASDAAQPAGETVDVQSACSSQSGDVSALPPGLTNSAKPGDLPAPAASLTNLTQLDASPTAPRRLAIPAQPDGMPASPPDLATPAESDDMAASPPGLAMLAQAADAPALPPGLAMLTAAARQAAQSKPAQKPTDPATPQSGDAPQAPVQLGGEAVPTLLDGKAVAPATAAKPVNAIAPDRRPGFEIVSKSGDTAQGANDLLNAAAAQSTAAAANNPAISSTTHLSANQASAAGSASTPQPQLAPVPLSGVPVLIAGKALAGNNHFDIRLDPPELGRIEVRLKVDRDGQVSSHLIADRADTLSLLQRDQTGLQRALQDAGLKTSGDGLQFSLRDQNGNGQPDGRPTPSPMVQDNSNPTPDPLPRRYASYTVRAGGVDIHV